MTNNDKIKDATKLITLGKDPAQFSGSVSTPIFQTSTVVFPDLASFHKAESGRAIYPETPKSGPFDYGYGIAGTPTTFALQQAIAELEQGDRCVLTSSGLAAITTSLLSFLKAGDHLLMVDTVYGPTRRFCNKELKKFGIETTYYDPAIGTEIEELIQKNTRVIFLESPGSLTFEVQDIPAIVKIAKQNDIITIADNSWGAPLYYHPLTHGVDVSVIAVTKYIGGHSDIIMGAIIAKESHVKPVMHTMRHYGMAVSPYDCSLALRGLRTVGARLKQQQESTEKLLEVVKNIPQVSKILHPSVEDHSGHEFWKRDFSGAASFFSVVLDKKYSKEQLAKMLDEMKYFLIGVSWGGFESLVIDFDPKTIRTATEWQYDGSCLRFYIGLEHVNDLTEDLEDGFGRLS